MAQFDVYKNSNPSTKSIYPYLLDIQNNFLDGLQTTVVIPLASENKYAEKPFTNLNPIISMENKNYIIVTTLLSGVDKSILGDKVTSLKNLRDDIISAIDFLITGI